jgi:hypothetical protein
VGWIQTKLESNRSEQRHFCQARGTSASLGGLGVADARAVTGDVAAEIRQDGPTEETSEHDEPFGAASVARALLRLWAIAGDVALRPINSQLDPPAHARRLTKPEQL